MGDYAKVADMLATLEAERDALKDHVSELVEALAGVNLEPHGEYGGPLVSLQIRYEDGTATMIGHEAFRTIRTLIAKHQPRGER